MTRKQQRLGLLALGMAALAGATAQILSAFSSNLVFFYSPSDLKTQALASDRLMRIGGLVEKQSVSHSADGHMVSFRITDGKTDIGVVYRGILPDLFREGRGLSPKEGWSRATSSPPRPFSPSTTSGICRERSSMR